MMTTHARAAGDLTDRQFNLLCEIAQTEAGLMISNSKRQMIQSRLTRHLRDLHCTDIDEYLNNVLSDLVGSIKNDLISVLTTNVSKFFRENHHFETFERDLLPNMLKKARAGGKVRIWSAGCSSGQEPYSIAMTLLNKVPDLSSLDIKVLGTDIDRKIIGRARKAKYSEDEANTLTYSDRNAFLERLGDADNAYRVSNQVRELVAIRPLNLLRDWPMKGAFDAIFCRNVLIYFDIETQTSLWPRFHAALHNDGYLFLGHSERIQKSETFGFYPCGVTTYHKNHQTSGQRSS